MNKTTEANPEPSNTARTNTEIIETYRHRVIVLLTVIGLWLALPATCGLTQRIVDHLTSFDIVAKNTGLFIKLSTDICMGIIYIIGLIVLVFLGVTGYLATVTIDKAAQTYHAAKPKIDEGKAIATNMYIAYEPPELRIRREQIASIVSSKKTKLHNILHPKNKIDV